MSRTFSSPLIRYLTIVLISFIVFYSFSTIRNFHGHCSSDNKVSSMAFHDGRVELSELTGIDQFNQELISYMKDFHVFPPSKSPRRYSEPYGYRKKYINESRNTLKIIQTYLKNKTHGIFVEAGANNGADEISNTLVFERDYNWSGLLVEGSPLIFPRLRAANRRSYLADVLLSKSTKTELVVFRHSDNPYGAQPLGEIGTKPSVVSVAGENGLPVYDFEVLSVPLATLLSAVGYTTIDFLSLDVEGTEADILSNFPFDKIFVKTLIVEFNIMPEERTKQMVNDLIKRGFKVAVKLERDIIFVHETIYNDANAES